MTMAKRLICALVSAICRFGKSIGKRGLYGKVGKAQRVAVLRALRKMTLPGTWHVRRTGYECCLYDICSGEGVARAIYGRTWVC
jgi:hypothetical protein